MNLEDPLLGHGHDAHGLESETESVRDTQFGTADGSGRVGIGPTLAPTPTQGGPVAPQGDPITLDRTGVRQLKSELLSELKATAVELGHATRKRCGKGPQVLIDQFGG